MGDLGGSLQEGSSPEEDPGGEAWAKDTAQASALDRLAGSITNRDVGTQPLQVRSTLICMQRSKSEFVQEVIPRVSVSSMKFHSMPRKVVSSRNLLGEAVSRANMRLEEMHCFATLGIKTSMQYHGLG